MKMSAMLASCKRVVTQPLRLTAKQSPVGYAAQRPALTASRPNETIRLFQNRHRGGDAVERVVRQPHRLYVHLTLSISACVSVSKSSSPSSESLSWPRSAPRLFHTEVFPAH